MSTCILTYFPASGGWASQMSLGAMHRAQQWSSSAHHSFQMWRTWLETIIFLLEEDSVLQGNYFFMNKQVAWSELIYLFSLEIIQLYHWYSICCLLSVGSNTLKRVAGDWGVPGQHFNAWHNFTQNCWCSPKVPIALQLVPLFCSGDKNISSSCYSKNMK